MRHDGSQQSQVVAQHSIHCVQRGILHCRVAVAQVVLHSLQEEGAIFVPEEGIEGLRVGVELVLAEAFCHGGVQVLQLGEDVDVNGGELRSRLSACCTLHHTEAGCVVQLVGEVLAFFNLLLVELDVGTGGGDSHQTETQTVGAVLGNQVERVGAVAQALAHLAAQQVTHNGGEEYVAEGLAACKAVAGHNHAGHPEEDDIRAGHQVAGGVELGQAFLVHGGEGPQPAAEPGVQRVFVLHPVLRVCGGLYAHIDIAGGGVLGIQLGGSLEFCGFLLAVPHRDAVPPPQLAGNAPVLNSLQPVGVGLGPVGRAEHDIAIGHGLGSFLHAGVLQEPLHAQARFNRHIGTLGDTHVVLVFFHLLEQALGLNDFDGFLTSHEAIQTVQLGATRAVDVAVSGQHVDNLQVVLHAHLKVGAVMSRGNLQCAGTKVDFHVVISNNRNFGIAQRADNRLANQVGEAGILRVNSYGYVSHDGFRTCGGNQQLSAAVCQLVADGVKLALGWGHDDLFIGKRGKENGIPVHHAVTAVDETFVEQLGEYTGNLRGVYVVHGEALALPVAGAAELLELVDDDTAVFILPLPYHVHEILAAYIEAGAGRILLGKFLFHAGLGGNTGVVGAGQPEHFLSFLAGAAGKNILNCIVQHVAHVQHTCHIGRGDYDAIGGLVGAGVCVEATL